MWLKHCIFMCIEHMKYLILIRNLGQSWFALSQQILKFISEYISMNHSPNDWQSRTRSYKTLDSRYIDSINELDRIDEPPRGIQKSHEAHKDW